ncbi:hypothetical protein [Serratia entomophila]|uniref:Uncharacterized protein n=1 Tax=Serratia entomophila TaxID=42906 RepID=A0ABY5CP35_9GAMM|nr:hypothetical protein [Serratia entomophila]USU99421.1 hypothetical protein KFQ06_15305 [Serratia entomophila]
MGYAWAAPAVNGEKILSQRNGGGEGGSRGLCCIYSSSSAPAVANAAALRTTKFINYLIFKTLKITSGWHASC